MTSRSIVTSIQTQADKKRERRSDVGFLIITVIVLGRRRVNRYNSRQTGTGDGYVQRTVVSGVHVNGYINRTLVADSRLPSCDAEGIVTSRFLGGLGQLSLLSLQGRW